jgi:hypothetical protein
MLAELKAQTINGHLLEAGTDSPIMLCELQMLTESGEFVAYSVSNESGYFSVSAPDSGSFLLRAERMGYQTRVEGVFELGSGSVMTIEFRLPREPVALDTLGVSAEARSVWLESVGFYERRRDLKGVFLGPEEIHEKQASLPTQLFHNLPRIRVRQLPFGSSTIIIRGSAMISLIQRGICYPRVFVNGNEVFRGGEEPSRIDDVVSVSELVGIEVYRGPAEIPTRYLGARSSCGLVLMWTR